MQVNRKTSSPIPMARPSQDLLLAVQGFHTASNEHCGQDYGPVHANFARHGWQKTLKTAFTCCSWQAQFLFVSLINADSQT